jgi:hypothetical protein
MRNFRVALRRCPSPKSYCPSLPAAMRRRIYEVNMESRLHISQALKTKLDLAIIFQNQNE